MTDTMTPTDNPRRSIRRTRQAAALFAVLIIAGVLVWFVREGTTSDLLLTDLGLAFAMTGVGAEGAVLLSRARKKHRATVRLAPGVASGATLAGGLLTVAAIGLDLQEAAGDGYCFFVLTVLLGLALALMAGVLVWTFSTAVPSSDASGEPGRHVSSPDPRQP